MAIWKATPQEVARLRARIGPNPELPDFVFTSHEWGSFHLFEASDILDAIFLEWAPSLAAAFDETHVCVLSLEDGMPGASPFCVDAGTSRSAYTELMADDTYEWHVRMFLRFCVGPPKGSWCIYAEGNNEVAILALPTGELPRGAADILKQLQAMDLTREQWTGDPHAHSKAFEKGIRRHYGSRLHLVPRPPAAAS